MRVTLDILRLFRAVPIAVNDESSVSIEFLEKYDSRRDTARRKAGGAKSDGFGDRNFRTFLSLLEPFLELDNGVRIKVFTAKRLLAILMGFNRN